MEGRIEDFDKFLRQVKRARQEIKSDRPDFWKKNRINFKNNIKTLIGSYNFPEDWTVNTIASSFLLDREVMPYDTDVFSFSDVVSATKEQGFNIIIFFNKTDLEFLSLPALLPIVVHEAEHVYQVPKDTRKYVLSGIDDNISKEFERGADAEVKKYSDEFRRENVLEKIMFCYDKRGWEGAKKMADYLYKEAENAFGGGYDQEMKKDEYRVFIKAYDEKDIDIFIDSFIESINKEAEKVEKKMKKSSLYLRMAIYFASVYSIIDFGTKYVERQLLEIEKERREKELVIKNPREKKDMRGENLDEKTHGKEENLLLMLWLTRLTKF